jgi:hypothetical protein
MWLHESERNRIFIVMIFHSCLGLILCQIWISVDYIASTASIFNLLTLSLDRYWSITSPLQYLGKRTRTRALYLIGFAWGLSLLWIIPIFSWHRFNGGKRLIEVSHVYSSIVLFNIVFVFTFDNDVCRVSCVYFMLTETLDEHFYLAGQMWTWIYTFKNIQSLNCYYQFLSSIIGSCFIEWSYLLWNQASLQKCSSSATFNEESWNESK